MSKYTDEEIAELERAAYDGMLFYPTFYMDLARTNDPEMLHAFVMEQLAKLPAAWDQYPVLKKLPERANIKQMIEEAFAKAPPSALKAMQHDACNRIRRMAARRRYLDSGGEDQEAYDALVETLGGGDVKKYLEGVAERLGERE